MITQLLANCAVSDLERAEQWYVRLFGRAPDARPMPGLLEWHLAQTFGVQLWTDPDRAGKSTVVLRESELDAAADRLTRVGIDHDGPQPGGGARILQIVDPDGNSVVLTGP